MALSLTASATTLSTSMSPRMRSRAAASRRWATGSLSSLRFSASAASSFWSTTSSSTRRNRSEETSSGSPSPIRPWATASRFTSEAQTVLPSTLATAWSPRSGGLSRAAAAAAGGQAQRQRDDQAGQDADEAGQPPCGSPRMRGQRRQQRRPSLAISISGCKGCARPYPEARRPRRHIRWEDHFKCAKPSSFPTPAPAWPSRPAAGST